MLTGKPNSWDEAEVLAYNGDEDYRASYKLNQNVPTQKYIEPQTSNQEYGWISQPLLPLDKNDRRLFHPLEMSPITKMKELEWSHEPKNLSSNK